MSFCIAVVIPEGIVVAGESRQTQIVAGVNRVSSDSAVKVFDLTPTVIAATTGWAFLQPPGATLQRNISGIVENFKPTIPPGSTVKEIAALLWTYFNAVYQNHITILPKAAVAPGITAVNFLVAGYDPGSVEGVLYAVEIPSAAPPAQPVRSTNSTGPYWIGQTDVVSRILKGYDIRMLNFPFVKTALENNEAQKLLGGLEYSLFCNTMTVQDAVDFAVAMIQVTIIVQRFTAGILTQLGSIAGVGGPIDIALVRPRTAIRWIARKELHS